MQREEFQQRLGDRIRELRLKRGWTQDVFADKSGFHRAQVGAFERGEMNLTLASILLLAQTLRVKVADLLRVWMNSGIALLASPQQGGRPQVVPPGGTECATTINQNLGR